MTKRKNETKSGGRKKEGKQREKLLRKKTPIERRRGKKVQYKGEFGEGKVMAMWRRPPAMNIQSNRVTAVKCLYSAHRV